MESNLLQAVLSVKSNEIVRTQIGKCLDFSSIKKDDMQNFLEFVDTDMVLTRDQKFGGVKIASAKDKAKALMLFDATHKSDEGIAIGAIFRGELISGKEVLNPADIQELLNICVGKKLFCREQKDSSVLKYRNEAGLLVPRTVYVFEIQ